MDQQKSICFLKGTTDMKNFHCFTDLFTVPHSLLMYVPYMYIYIYNIYIYKIYI